MKIRLVARVPLLVASLAIAVSEQEQRDAGGWHKAIFRVEEVHYLKCYSVGLRMLFDSRRSLKNYLDHPKHRAVADFVLKSVDEYATIRLVLRPVDR